MPIIHGTYYDPWKKTLECDKNLLKVVVNPEWSLKECIEEAETYHGERFFELEKKGSLYFVRGKQTTISHLITHFFSQVCLVVR
jgi:hypothetical protein